MKNYNEVIKKFVIGRTFKASINGSICEGKIQKEKAMWFLCQDKMNGNNCRDRLGYKYSWLFNEDTRYQIVDFEFTDEPKEQNPELWQEGDVLWSTTGRGDAYILAVTKNGLIISRTKDIKNVFSDYYTQKELETISWIKEKQKVKITMKAIAEKFGFELDEFEIVK